MSTALVVGASGGLGQAIVAALEAAEVRVLQFSRAGPDRGEGAAVDLSSDAQVAAACLWVAQQGVALDLIVYSAGAMHGGTLADTSGETFSRLFADNVLSAHLVHRHAAPLMAEGAHRVVLGAYADKLLFPKLGAYAAVKAALDAWARVLVKEDRAVKTTLLRLPAVDTPLWKRAPFPLPKGALAPAAVATAVVQAWRDAKGGVVDL